RKSNKRAPSKASHLGELRHTGSGGGGSSSNGSGSNRLLLASSSSNSYHSSQNDSYDSDWNSYGHGPQQRTQSRLQHPANNLDNEVDIYVDQTYAKRFF